MPTVNIGKANKREQPKAKNKKKTVISELLQQVN